jgi:hypothetical protein
MLKRGVILLSCLFYFALTAGIHLQLHSCCGAIVSWQLATKGESDEEKHGNCCHKPSCCDSQEIHIQLQDDQETPNSYAYSLGVTHQSMQHQERPIVVAFHTKSSDPERDESPPDPFKDPLFIRIHQLIFYA